MNKWGIKKGIKWSLNKYKVLYTYLGPLIEF